MISGIDRVTYGVEDLPLCKRFFLDWGLSLATETATRLVFETVNNSEIHLVPNSDITLPPPLEPGSSVRSVTWGVEKASDLELLSSALKDTTGFARTPELVSCVDPNGLTLEFRVSQRKKTDVRGVPANVYGLPPQRVDAASPIYERARPIEIGHVVFFTPNLAEVEAFYLGKLGFVESDRYVGRSLFMRCSAYGGHHDVLFVQLPNGRRGLNHVAFLVRDIHEVFGGGLHISRCGWQTEIGPGMHPVSSAFFWYVKCPAGGNTEYYTDEDQLTPAWKPRQVETKPENFAEWAIEGGIDGFSRRQNSAAGAAPAGIAGQAAGAKS